MWILIKKAKYSFCYFEKHCTIPFFLISIKKFPVKKKTWVAIMLHMGSYLASRSLFFSETTSSVIAFVIATQCSLCHRLETIKVLPLPPLHTQHYFQGNMKEKTGTNFCFLSQLFLMQILRRDVKLEVPFNLYGPAQNLTNQIAG